MASIRLQNIVKAYPNGFVAVKDLNLDINDKEFIIFVGPSGCGKSTTLRMIAGLEEISGGQLLIDDKLMNTVKPKDRDIAMVFQNYALYPHMTVYNNIAFGLKLKKVPKKEIKKKVEEVAALLGIERLLQQKPRVLSGGQCQRVAMGRAIIREPKVFLMDEPLSNLDAKLRIQMRTVISRLHKKLQTTFIYVTHDQTEAMTLATKIVVMKDGIVQQIDSPYNLYSKPRNLFVAGFIGSPPMNFINAIIKKEDDFILLCFSDIKIKLSGLQAKTVAEKGEREVILGIRTEDLSICQDDYSDDVMSAYVEITELLGAETLVHINVGGNSVIISTKSNLSIKSGDSIKIRMDLEKIHIFNKSTEMAI